MVDKKLFVISTVLVLILSMNMASAGLLEFFGFSSNSVESSVEDNLNNEEWRNNIRNKTTYREENGEWFWFPLWKVIKLVLVMIL